MDIPTLRCVRCAHAWIPRSATPPAVCPSCGTAKWRSLIAPNDGQGQVQTITPQKSVILKTNKAIGVYDEKEFEALMRFVGEFTPTLTEDEEKFLRRLCQSLRLNIEVTIRGEHVASEQQESNSNKPARDFDAEMRKLEEDTRPYSTGQETPRRSRKKTG